MSDSKILKVIELIEEFEKRLDSKMNVPFTRSILVKKSDFEDLLDGIKEYLPEEYVSVQNIYNKIGDISKETNTKAREALNKAQLTADEIMTDAENNARQLISQAEAKAASLITNHEIIRQAKGRANEIMQNAEKNARYTILSALEYSSTSLKSCEAEVFEIFKELQSKSKKVESELIAKKGK